MFGRRSLLERGWDLSSVWEILKSPSCYQSCGRSWKMFPKEDSDLLLLCALMEDLWLERLIHRDAPPPPRPPQSASSVSHWLVWQCWGLSKGMPNTWRRSHRELSCEAVPLALKSLTRNLTLVSEKNWSWIFSIFVNTRNSNKISQIRILKVTCTENGKRSQSRCFVLTVSCKMGLSRPCLPVWISI